MFDRAHISRPESQHSAETASVAGPAPHPNLTSISARLGQSAQVALLKRTENVLNGGVIQRYSAHEDGKISQHGNLLLRSPDELYAGEAQFSEANAIGGDVEFVAGDVVERPKRLNRVIAQIKPDSALATKAALHDPARDERRIRAQTVEPILQKAIEQEIAAILKDALSKMDEQQIQDTYETNDRADALEQIEIQASEDASEKIESLTAQERAGYLDASPIVARLEAYLEREREAAAQIPAKPLMDSDCSIAAQDIAGFNFADGVETNTPEAGAIYEYQNINEELAEWKFHYATIIMTDGNDHVTMESAGAKASEGFKKLELDRSWQFKMFGKLVGQSFAEEYYRDMGGE